MFPEHVETGRLHLRRFDEHVGLQAAHDHFGQGGTVPEEMAYLTHEPNETLKETRDELAEMADDWAAGEAATYAVVPKASEDGAGDLAGDAVLLPQWDERVAFLGVRLRKRFWGRGYSGERAAALLAVTFDHLDLDLASPACHPDNEQSERAIEKYVDRFGGTDEGRLRNWVPMGDEVADMHRWSISRGEYEANRPTDRSVTIHGEQ